jgi:hypothetical protein
MRPAARGASGVKVNASNRLSSFANPAGDDERISNAGAD